VAEPLVFYRVGAQAFKRRGGAELLRSELRLQREFRRQGFTSLAEYVRNVIVRGGYRMIPWWCRRAVYRPIVARYTERLEQDLAARASSEPAEPPEWSASSSPAGPWGAGQPPVSQ
jgi:hypothetical protein